MSGTRTFTLSLLAAALSAQTLYLPLDEGNLWLYHGDGGLLAMEVGSPAEFGGNRYHLVRGLSGNGGVWVRNDSEGRILVWDEHANRERVLLDAAAPEGAPYDTVMDACSREAVIESRAAKYSGPAGEFENVLHVAYRPGPCMDAGLSSEDWLAWVGMLRRVRVTIAGLRKYDLVYARLGGVTYVRAPQTGFSISLTPSGNVLLVRMTLRHTLEWPLRLSFSSSQRFDVAAYNADGKEFYRWSEGRAFLTVMGREEIRGEKTWVAEIPVSEWPEGEYAIQAWLTPLEGYAWRASAIYRH